MSYNFNRFEKFEKSNIYELFGTVLKVVPELVMVSDYEYYNDNLEYLKDTFGCNIKPTNLQLTTYITNNEYIDDVDMIEFIIMIDVIFDKYISIQKLLKKNYAKHILKERNNKEKAELKERINKEKSELNELLNKEKAERKECLNKEKAELKERLIREKAELKEQQKKQLREFNNTVIQCECGLEYVRFTKSNHYKSLEHRYRIDGIRWFKQNQDLTYDTDSAIDDSSISSVGTS